MKEIWNKVLSDVGEKISQKAFDIWLKPIRLLNLSEGQIELEVPNKFFKDWISENYQNLIRDSLFHLTGQQYAVYFVVKEVSEEKAEKARGTERTAPTRPVRQTVKEDGLNPNYTFDAFVVGSCNQFAHAAALAVANLPAKNYNPLFIYGGVGLGKTHLINAIGNQILENDPSANISYTSSEKFTNELINCLRYEKMTDFRNKYRNKDVLLLDDVQFLGGKERTQEEFFHTFNSLYESHRQIVITSDKLPKEIPGLEERLRSRISWGLIADIQPPDIETKVAILCKKAELFNISLSNEVGLFLASNLGTNIRELEGALTRLRAYSSLTGSEINEAMAKETLKDILNDRQKMISIDNIQKTVASFYNVSVSDLKSSKKLKIYALPRQVAMYLCRGMTQSSFPEIGEKFGGKDHSTVIHAVRQIEKRINHDRELKNTIETLKNHLQK
ncbi:MAG: chromosomal replication initiation protein [Deltaproteobacteria bacterium SM23_61]|nr:MAG: chromosomal replication initiation protein [Deltaproteobacteria bacterium SM23_61]